MRQPYHVFWASVLFVMLAVSFGLSATLPVVKMPSPAWFSASSESVQKVRAPKKAPQVMVSQSLRFQHILVTDVTLWLKKNAWLHKGVQYWLDTAGNDIWLQGPKKRVASLIKRLQSIDKPAHQIMIYAKIIDLDNHALREMGVDMTSAEAQLQSLSHIQLPLFHLRENKIDAVISALSSSGHAQVIAEPQLLTINNRAAVIESGDEIPYQQSTENGGTSAAFKKAVLRLQVTPHLLSAHRLQLSILLNQDQAGSTLINGVPTIRTRQLRTQVQLLNRQTLLLGGIAQSTAENSRRGLVFLSHIPIIGWLLSHHERHQSRQSLWIMLTPHVMN